MIVNINSKIRHKINLLCRLVLLFPLFALFASQALADDMRPASLTITATSNTNFDVVWKVPLRNGKKEPIQFALPDKSQQVGLTRKHIFNNAYIEYSSFQREDGLTGVMITIDGIERSTGDVLVRIIGTNQETFTTVLNVEKPNYLIKKMVSLSTFDTAITYTEIGIKHILIGLDHLLFVACLVYISGSRKKLFYTITGFTLAHSVTLFLAATNVMVIPIEPVEAVIALSIIFLAWEIAKNRQHSLSLRYPVLVSSSFGLLHGFGFAAVLSDIGLPESEKSLALLSFNIGVEIGQLLFVIALFLLVKLASSLYQWRRKKPLTLTMLRLPISYFCGITATLWFIERLTAF
ncbi:HupE/UreJ family protein [Colwellia piezophila]|uniref:HupE/UreJ family protein n=1 Tax=Colwellia piezophila TaxID=211668 RepID=UPI000372AE6E|nr:HupE/UreJ family protein [Colwellia piezophila]